MLAFIQKSVTIPMIDLFIETSNNTTYKSFVSYIWSYTWENNNKVKTDVGIIDIYIYDSYIYIHILIHVHVMINNELWNWSMERNLFRYFFQTQSYIIHLMMLVQLSLQLINRNWFCSNANLSNTDFGNDSRNMFQPFDQLWFCFMHIYYTDFGFDFALY